MLAYLAPAAAAPGQTVIDAERAFAAAAQRDGQWTAFRATAAPDAVMFVPGMVNAQAWLKGRTDPKEAIVWWPISALVSCDGTLAVSVGGWTNDGGKAHGTFTTVWKRTAEGWRWVLDQGHDTPEVMSRPEVPTVERASCEIAPELRSMTKTVTAPNLVIQLDNAMPSVSMKELETRTAKAASTPGFNEGARWWEGQSTDGSLRFSAHGVETSGLHGLTIYRWNGSQFEVARLELSIP